MQKTKIFCDQCNAELAFKDLKQVRTWINEFVTNLELCAGCLKLGNWAGLIGKQYEAAEQEKLKPRIPIYGADGQ